MPQWAGSCWYYLRYLDPTNENAFVDPEVERYWMGPQSDGATAGGVDLYVGGVEHAVLHLLYARFWHKVLFDLGHVSTPEPFQRLFNQGYIQAAAYTDERGCYVEAAEVERARRRLLRRASAGAPGVREDGQEPEERGLPRRDLRRVRRRHAAALRDVDGPARRATGRGTRATSSACTGSCSGCGATLVDEDDRRRPRVDRRAGRRPSTRRLLHRTIAGVRDDMEALRFNTAIAKLIELNNHLTESSARGATPREVAEPMVLMLAPLAPARGRGAVVPPRATRHSLVYEPFPEADPALLVDDDGRAAGAGQRQGARPRPGGGRRHDGDASRRPRWPTTRCRPRWRAGHRRRSSWCPAAWSRSSSEPPCSAGDGHASRGHSPAERLEDGRGAGSGPQRVIRRRPRT